MARYDRFCRWCKYPNPIQSVNKSGLCKKHWTEYQSMYNDIMVEERKPLNRHDICQVCGENMKLKTSKMCAVCYKSSRVSNIKHVSEKKYCNEPGCGRYLRNHDFDKCFRCRKNLRKTYNQKATTGYQMPRHIVLM